MTTLEIAKKYVELCKANQHETIRQTLFSANVVSVEAIAMPGFPIEAKGLNAIAEKSKAWTDNHEIHSSTFDGPWPNGNRFVVRFSYDVTNKPSGRRIQMDEVGLFTVENEKITREEFFYSMEG
jgi:hypothetical protein